MKPRDWDVFPFPAQWRWRRLLLCQLTAVFVLVTWFAGPVQSLWAYVDESAFLALNGWLLSSVPWQKPLAFANTRLYDKLAALLLASMLLAYVVLGWGEDMARRLAAAAFIGLYALTVVTVRRETGWLDYGRPSPSLTMSPFFDLRESFPDMRPKTTDASAFPSDHAIACVIFVALFWRFAGWKAGLTSLVVSPAFVMPRIIGGAHWLTDFAVGGMAFALAAVSWAVHTPLAGASCRALHRLFLRMQWFIGSHLDRGSATGSNPSAGNGNRPGGP